ncbi:SPOR domain-containing protein [Roseivirga sp. BDSF3-8]|uniref:SPOR domain-containing protein n=1 Tax=Roseivirga sp. BDSF3-8 TaxID=3241598 RepID=UPI0035318F0A
MSTRDHENEEDFDNGREHKHEDDDFGLPEVEYDQVRDEDEYHEQTEDEHYVAATKRPQITRERREEKSSSAAPLIIVLILLLIAVGGGVWWFFLREKTPEPVKEVAEETTTTEPEPVEEDFSSGYEEEETFEEEPAQPAQGQIQSLSSRTGRYYVVVNSFFDGDMAKDYAQKLSNDGINVSIILPSGKNKFHRVAVEDFDSYAAAVDRAEELKATYGNETWAVRY